MHAVNTIERIQFVRHRVFPICRHEVDEEDVRVVHKRAAALLKKLKTGQEHS
jgi:hypothetical protein